MRTLIALRAKQLSGLTRLDLSCGLTEFPREIFDLADSLEILNLSGNALSALPDDLPRLHKLRVIFCSDNRFSELPAILGRCPQLEMVGFKANQIRHVSAAALPKQLRWLILTDNQIRELPSTLGGCQRLQKLMLAGNQLHTLPDSLAHCENLELLRISANRFETLPVWLLDLPRLAWLAYAANPCSDRYEQAALARPSIAHINWDSLDLHHTLGEGASGVIYRAHHQQDGGVQPVAVKMFKGALTSDGLPRSEKSAYLAAGEHPCLIPVKGKISGHPDAAPGLVMSLIEASFVNLAQPPSLASCTRDCYAPELRFTPAQALAIAHGIASVAAHLHAQGVIHGDLYAHNILWNESGDCLLGDFGAASFLPPEERVTKALQRLEVRAFGCLLEELLARCTLNTESQTSLVTMHALQQSCMQIQPSARPLFAEIEQTLCALAFDTQHQHTCADQGDA